MTATCIPKDSGSVIRLRVEALRQAQEAAGLRTTYALARAAGCQQTTLARVIRGSRAAGPAVIGHLLRALPDARFEELFEVVRPGAA